MPSPMETHSQQLRTQIARSRRRLERHARQLTSGTTQLLNVGRFAQRGSGRSWLIALAAGLVLSRWVFRTESLRQWRQKLLGQIVPQWLDRLVRRIRVAAWQFRRSTGSATAEVTDE